MADLVSSLLFESMDDCVECCRHCGLHVTEYDDFNSDGDDDSGRRSCSNSGDKLLYFVRFEKKQSIDELLPKDKNSLPIQPRTAYMKHWIDDRKAMQQACSDKQQSDQPLDVVDQSTQFTTQPYPIYKICRGELPPTVM